jgi:hypothetical protein
MNYINYTYNEPDIVILIKVRRLRWLDSFLENAGADLLSGGWIQLEGDLKTMGVRNWRRKSQDRDKWRTFVKRSRFITDCSARGRRSPEY